MSKFRSKLRIIDAEQWKPGKFVPGACACHQQQYLLPHVHTIHKGQIALIEPGDWIIAEPDGKHFYPCKPDIFKDNYEAIRGRQRSRITND